MTGFIFSALLFGLLLAGAFFILPLRAAARRKKRLAAAFGRPPEKMRGLTLAEDYLAAFAAQNPDARLVDDTTFADLDGDEVFFRLNACQSAAGDIRLYSVLRSGGVPDEELQARHTLACLFEENRPLALAAQYPLAKLGRLDGVGIEMMAFASHTYPLRHRWVLYPLALLPLLAVGLLFFSLPLGIAALFITISANLYLSTYIRDSNDGAFRHVRYLSAAIHCAGRLARLLQKPAGATAAGLTAATKGLHGLRRSIAFLNLNHALEETLGFDPLTIFLLPALSYGRIAARLPGRTADIALLYRLVGEVDLAAALASTRCSLPQWCTPVFWDQPSVAFTDIRHPLLQQAVPNSARLSRDVLLTGSNASGKSTFIKAVALNCLLAQTLYTCTAQSFSLKKGFVATSMAVRDDLDAGDSYFVAEIKSMRRLLALCEAQPFCYLFIDEILKGTNTVERIAASAAVLQKLAAARCLCFAATHDIELTRMLGGLFDNHHFREVVTDLGVVFDYRLQGGPSGTRNAILLLKTMGFPPDVMQTADSLVAGFEGAGEWSSLSSPPG